jgi:hypothetical protein
MQKKLFVVLSWRWLRKSGNVGIFTNRHCIVVLKIIMHRDRNEKDRREEYNTYSPRFSVRY